MTAELRLGLGRQVNHKRMQRLILNEACRDRLWVQDVTQHRSGEGWVYLAVVIDAWSRRAPWTTRPPARHDHRTNPVRQPGVTPKPLRGCVRNP